MIDRKIKKWGNWYKAERWLNDLSLQNKLGLEKPNLWWVFMDKKFPSNEERLETLMEGWKIEVVGGTWWKKIILNQFPQTSEFCKKVEEKDLWILRRMEESKVDYPKLVREEESWILYENQFWSKKRLEEKGIYKEDRVQCMGKVYGILGNVSLGMVQTMEAPQVLLYSILNRKGL
jgi:hypothetical protein